MQVGKKYVYKPANFIPNNKDIFECLKKTDDFAVMFCDRELSKYNNYSFTIPSIVFKDYVEYKELRKGVFWVNIYAGAGIHHGSVCEMRENADQYRSLIHTRIACVKVPWVEGQGLEKGSN